jgi:hypothetical protein
MYTNKAAIASTGKKIPTIGTNIAGKYGAIIFHLFFVNNTNNLTTTIII